MNRLFPVIAASALLLATAALAPEGATAGILAGPIPGATHALNPIERVALCFYPYGWAGPGLYQCGYAYRRGEGFVERREREERRERRDYYEDRRERYRDRYEDRRERYWR
jgi:hypothetical protein